MGRYDGGDSFMAALTAALGADARRRRPRCKQCIDNYVDKDELHAATYNRTQQ